MPIATMAKTYTFEAAHHLPHLGAEHKCARPHGHSYRVWVYCRGEIDPAIGWFKDYADVSEVMDPLVAKLDHSDLNVRFDRTPTTSENIAAWFLERLPAWVHKVRIHETPTSWVEIER